MICSSLRRVLGFDLISKPRRGHTWPNAHGLVGRRLRPEWHSYENHKEHTETVVTHVSKGSFSARLHVNAGKNRRSSILPLTWLFGLMAIRPNRRSPLVVLRSGFQYFHNRESSLENLRRQGHSERRCGGPRRLRQDLAHLRAVVHRGRHQPPHQG